MFQRIEQREPDPAKLWEGDLFDRADYAAFLCRLLKTSQSASVIGLNAPYGFGKTFFLRRLREQIKSEKGWVIYVNAWEYDYLDNPLFGLLDALKTAAGELPAKGKAKKALKEVVAAAAPALARAVSKAAVEKALGEGSSKDILDAVSEAAGKGADSLVEKFLNDDTMHKALAALRGQIQKFVAHNISSNSPYKALTIIVDELDRARPNFSIRFLEAIKHLFGASQTTFLIGCDKGVLSVSAKHEYGEGLDIDGYLRRLFDFWIDLPQPQRKPYIRHCAEVMNLISDNVLSGDGSLDTSLDDYASFLIDGCNGASASLRFFEQSVSQMNVVVRSLGPDRIKHVALVGWLQGLRHYNENTYAAYISVRSIDDVRGTVNSLPSFGWMDEVHKAFVIGWAVRNPSQYDVQGIKDLFGGHYGQLVADVLSDRIFRRVGEVSFARQVDKRLRTIGP